MDTSNARQQVCISVRLLPKCALKPGLALSRFCIGVVTFEYCKVTVKRLP